jgi:uncharacterized protein (DUF169 family)
MNKYQTQFKKIKQILNTKSIVSIRFSNKKSNRYKIFQDTACTALARSLKDKRLVYLDRKQGQLCAGGNYFLDFKKCSDKEVCDVYIKKEKVFSNQVVCKDFLQQVKKYKNNIKSKYILLSPLDKEVNKPDVVALLVNPAQASRIIGLSIFNKLQEPIVSPAGPLCLDIQAPFYSNRLHLNFIDYFDRYYQGKQGGRLIWEDGEMMIFCNYRIFCELLNNLDNSPHGGYKIKLKACKTSPIVSINQN